MSRSGATRSRPAAALFRRDASGKEARFGGVATHVFERQPDGFLKLKLHTFN